MSPSSARLEFGEIFGKEEPSIDQLSKYLAYLNVLMHDGDTAELTTVHRMLTEDSNFLSMIGTLRGTYAYKIRNDFPEWQETLTKVRGWMEKRDKNPYSLLHGLL